MNHQIQSYLIKEEPFYRASGDEVELFEAAYALRTPMILKGPTGCGKTRFMEAMAWRLKRPLITLACNEDMTASDLVGRYLLDAEGTVWKDGPLTLAARHGAICYLDEVVEARQDTLVVIHPLTDDRRILPLDKRGELIHAHPDFQLVMSYNPGYQSAAKDLKQSTKQRFGALDFQYPEATAEAEIVSHESGCDDDTAARLVGIAHRSRALRGRGLEEGISTRMLIRAASLIAGGIAPLAACRLAMTKPLTDDDDLLRALDGFIDAHFR
ncbi:CbbQ/NirQ/NorQ/GpvN family protein [Noviherbaspirillum pedocola]|uniref:CbbQ/NirQ/NorQ/GpvN family protein n=1 Tax=Noviherbaspirillum pedocola TaxID=2801341 RepID=A0A934SZM9_9BURK|nr:CbbQ/NirQ/NorQ/GpvN family protein [Noviherbaspirillum pedocola]MBK4738619.1 CbbQ/NirQ/NorQ/GpvN family protein [Noviherbaspirillum pedocola]